VENREQEAPIPEIWETEEEKKLSTFDLKTKYKKFLQATFQRHQYQNQDTGIWISVSSDCVNQWVKKSRTRERIILVQALNTLLENSQYAGLPETDRKSRTEIEHYKIFHQICKINGTKFLVTLKIVKPVQKPHKFYYYSIGKL
jgi:adenosyl cobinamide kinase/adenosyl cobinamide phosphate guanylyltransferase